MDGCSSAPELLDCLHAAPLVILVDELGIAHGEGIVKDLGRNRTFHDRNLMFDTADAAGGDAAHRCFLTGGVDYLLDERSDTKVFHAVVNK